MQIDPAATSPRDFYQLLIGTITPRPINWCSTLSTDGVTNLAPYSFFNGVTANPPTVVFSPVTTREGRVKDTARNILDTGEFVVNIVSFDMAEKMNATSAALDFGVSEFATVGLTPVPSVKVKPPRVKEARVQFECKTYKIVEVGEGPLMSHLIIGEILMAHIDDTVLDDKGIVDPGKLDTIGRMGGIGYARTTDRFNLPRP